MLWVSVISECSHENLSSSIGNGVLKACVVTKELMLNMILYVVGLIGI